MQSTLCLCKRVRAALLGAFVIAGIVSSPLAVGKSGTPDPVAIEGVVEVLNDTLHQPYVVSQNTGATSVTAPTVYFDIPDGKRLIIETIAYQASLPAGENNRMFIQPLIGGDRQLIPLVIQDRVDAGGYYLVANIPFKMRIDSVDGSTQEVMIRRGTGGAGTLNATICGYLVDK